MEAKELMINDFVSYIDTLSKRKIGKITDLHHNESWETIYVDFCDQNPEGKSKITSVQPIPLTVEILEKNNWYQGECGNETLFFIPNKVFYLANSYKKGFMSIGVLIDGKMLNLFRIKYVHELQHALRLVGLNKVADNLKV